MLAQPEDFLKPQCDLWQIAGIVDRNAVAERRKVMGGRQTVEQGILLPGKHPLHGPGQVEPGQIRRAPVVR